MSPKLPRRRLLALVAGAASAGTLSGCGYRPGGGDVRWEDGTGTGPYRPDDLLASEGTVFTVKRSVRGFDFETEEWGESAEIAAYDAGSGGPRWETTTPPAGRPATSGGRLYLGHLDEGVVALGSDGGGVRWEATVDDFPRTVAAGSERVYALTETGALYAFGSEGGDRLWRTALGTDPDGTTVTGNMAKRASLAATGNGAVVHYPAGANERGSAVVAYGADGERRWTVERSAPPRYRPVVDDRTVFVGTDRTLFALSLDEGAERWTRSATGPRGSPAVGDGASYHVAGGVLFALDPRTGEVRWRFEPDGRRGLSSPAAAGNGQVYVGGGGAVYAVSASDGTTDWAVESAGVRDGPRVAGRSVVVTTEDGYVRAHYRE